jgi:hypothetical protein
MTKEKRRKIIDFFFWLQNKRKENFALMTGDCQIKKIKRKRKYSKVKEN